MKQYLKQKEVSLEKRERVGNKAADAVQKLENQDLKRKVLEWKKKALEQEALYHTAVQQHQTHQQHLIAQHESEMEALTAAHVEKVNHLSSMLLSFQQQPERESMSHQVHELTEGKHRETATRVIHHRQKATDLIVNMNELMLAIETKIQGYMDDNDDMETSEEEECYDSRTMGTITPPPDTCPPPRLKSKPTMEHLSKVIPSFLKSTGKSEQWKMTGRPSMKSASTVVAA
ncbi:hypothetical protein [Absidia glauca]|uniref:Uncharacterized protein n=1 Tax=Absidia glauca TaxID=4829 RepID=A0A168N8S4_ABSGL|nr:hypothetical protein [Absidia glauca]